MKMTLFATALDAVFPRQRARLGRKTQEEAVPSPDGALVLLIDRLRRHDATAFEPFIKKTETLGFRIAYHVTGDYHLAQDVLQEAYLCVFKKINTLREPAAFRAWFARIVTNLGIEQLRRSEKAVSLDNTQFLEEVQAAAGPGFAESCITLEDLRRALARLTPRERTALILRDYLCFTYQEMGTVLEIPIGTVKSRLAQAREKIARALR
jgi:RNA polymerase sigma-70 factor (ECF subfamily)